MFESVGREKEPDRRRRVAALLLSLLVNGGGVAALLWAGSAAMTEPAKAEEPPDRYVELSLPAPAGSPPAAAAATAPRPRSHHAETPPVAPPTPTPDVVPPVDPPDDPVADAALTPDGPTGPGGGGGSGTGPGTGNGPGGPGTGPGPDPGIKVVHWSEVVPRSRVKPRFPEAARVAGVREGACLVRIHIDARGVPTQVEPRDCPALFQDPTVSAAMLWRFEPVVQDGISVPAMFDLKVSYKSE
jgi:outer membrane biosynthesis protein TonB